MFNFGFTELIALGAIALIFIGPKQLPELARTLARLLNEFKRATGDFSSALSDVKSEAKKVTDDLKTDLLDQKEFEKNLLKILDEKSGDSPEGAHATDDSHSSHEEDEGDKSSEPVKKPTEEGPNE